MCTVTYFTPVSANVLNKEVRSVYKNDMLEKVVFVVRHVGP